MLLERTRMMSRSKCAKHIRVRYYFIKDCISAGDIVVKHFPTREMLSDHFTNTLQGELFQTFRAKIQGIPTPMENEEMCWGAPGYFNMEPEATNMTTSNPRPQEWVGKYRNCDLSTGSSQITGDEKRLDNMFCRGTNSRTVHNILETQSCTNSYVWNVHERPQISYSEAVNRGLASNTLRTK